MNRRNKILIIILMFLLIVTGILFFMMLNKNKEKDDINENLTVATTTLEERKLWNDFLKKNPYISEVEMNENLPLSDTDLIKLAITSENVETEYIVTEEIIKEPNLSKGDGYKKSKENIVKYTKETFNQDNIAYNFAETYVDGEEYLIMNEEYVYFTKIDLREKEYILMELEKEGNIFEATVYEYEVNDSNRSEIENMLESGNINQAINKSKVYKLTGTINGNRICVFTKNR